MTIAESIEIEGGYVVEIHYDEDASNPFKEFDGSPTLVLHTNAEGHFGWTNNDEWGSRLNAALEQASGLVWHRNQRNPRPGARGRGLPEARALVARWMRAFWGVRVMLPVGAGEHSGTWTYLGDGASMSDPQGWDSGWVGWLFATREQITEWAFDDRSDEELEKSLRASFAEFEAYVSGESYGYVVTHEDGHAVADDSCWGFYGSESYDERVEWPTRAMHLRPGMTVKTIGELGGLVADVEHEGGEVSVDFADGGVNVMPSDSTVTIVSPGYMREAFMEVIEYDRKLQNEDQAEIDEMRLAEVGV